MRNLMIKIVMGYKKIISPLLPASCRYYPTCSTYMIDAIRKHGSFLGFIMGCSRILRCHPFIKGGYDPVSDNFTIFRNKRASEKYRRSMNLK